MSASIYKKEIEPIQATWANVDKCLRDALGQYEKIMYRGQVKYLDLIVRLLIVRAYAYLARGKTIKSSNILEHVG